MEVALLLMFGIATAAHGWTTFGHRLVAQLAYDRLTPATRAQVDALLALEPGADIRNIASWADEIRKQPGFEATGTLHYVNFPYRSCAYEPARDCPDEACVVAALDRYSTALGDQHAARQLGWRRSSSWCALPATSTSPCTPEIATTAAATASR